MKKKPYKAKSLSGAQRRVREMERTLESYKEVIEKFDKQRCLLAKLAAKGPAFSTPLEAWAAENLRDSLLREQGMNPDGSFIKRDTNATAE